MAEHLPRGSESRSWTVWLCPDCGLPEITPNATHVYGVETCPGFEAATDQNHHEAEPVEFIPRDDAEALAHAVSASLAQGEKSPLEAALTVYRSKHPWSDL